MEGTVFSKYLHDNFGLTREENEEQELEQDIWHVHELSVLNIIEEEEESSQPPTLPKLADCADEKCPDFPDFAQYPPHDFLEPQREPTKCNRLLPQEKESNECNARHPNSTNSAHSSIPSISVSQVPICKYFSGGYCKYHDKCIYRHESPSTAPTSLVINFGNLNVSSFPVKVSFFCALHHQTSF
eukprot:TRINITY_DN2872_c0_g4_i1.p1 TRINITY_DN2872_c0_g4~~TRINITY_DN2872_c0_g4_i1.p1  ORF type:complete len:196 (+),score=38.37 TRINITY_DN2872_c0_g4_i1:36-590(+)